MGQKCQDQGVDFQKKGMERLKSLIIESLNLEGITIESIKDDQPLISEGLGLDSVDALELVVVLEKAYGIKIRSQEIEPRIFSSISSLHDFIQKNWHKKRDYDHYPSTQTTGCGYRPRSSVWMGVGNR